MEPTTTISIETTIHAAIEKVWQAWTEPELITKWFGSDPNGKVLNANLDVRPGGSFEVTFIDGDQTEHTCSGTYKAVKPFTKLTFTWQWKNEPGVESFIIISLTAMGNTTKMKLEHMNAGSATKHNYVKGWETTFLKLDKALG